MELRSAIGKLATLAMQQHSRHTFRSRTILKLTFGVCGTNPETLDAPLSSEYGTCKTVTARSWPSLSGESLHFFKRCSHLAAELRSAKENSGHSSTGRDGSVGRGCVPRHTPSVAHERTSPSHLDLQSATGHSTLDSQGAPDCQGQGQTAVERTQHMSDS